MSGLEIKAVEPGSAAFAAGLAAGDRITAVGGRPVRDIIDYYFYLAVAEPELTVRRGEREFSVRLAAEAGRPGLSFVSPFGRIRRCTNRCLFCFVDQQPPGLRPSLCFKDDDYRLSFWEGNFVTLTNCTRRDLKRIVAQRLSPLYVSVHTTNPELRARLMGNPRAAEIKTQLAALAAGGITLHTQVVLCPGLNDGAELERTVRDLASLFPAVRSVAVVPVGLTAHRAGLYPLRPVTPAAAAALIEDVTAWQREFRRRYGSRLVFAADEFYLLAGKAVPATKEYEGFPQLENGVGLVRRFRDAWKRVAQRLPETTTPCRAVLVTGTLAAPVLRPVVARLNAVAGLEVTLLPVVNRFFGTSVTVAGLLTGRDICAALAALFREGLRPELVVVPAAALRDGRLFLDDTTCAAVAEQFGCRVVAAAGPRELVAALGVKLTRRSFRKE
ncbi:DUF512 domain-containing protein [Thermodesulfitimonas autotrophica]|uniref:DUF512 domain-containing protein n=1 Tax=Thermodesulfitimonas autotrophica TaxID=1894989 RepID=UPI002FE07791